MNKKVIQSEDERNWKNKMGVDRKERGGGDSSMEKTHIKFHESYF